MAKDDLTGNLATEDLEFYFDKNNIALNLNKALLDKAYLESWDVFNKYHQQGLKRRKRLKRQKDY